MELLIGRDEKSSKLKILIENKCCLVGTTYPVPPTVSRCKPTEKKAHCSLIIGTSGKMKIINLNPNNVTYVNGEDIETSIINEDSIVELGADQYRISIKKILSAVGYEKPYSIKHLKRVWERYDRTLLNMELDKQKKDNRQKLSGILSQLSMLCVIIPSLIPAVPIPDVIRGVLIVGALSISVYMFVKGNKKDDSFIIKKRELNEDFKNNYVCPKCGKFLGFQSYDNIKDQDKCFKCGCRFLS